MTIEQDILAIVGPYGELREKEGVRAEGFLTLEIAAYVRSKLRELGEEIKGELGVPYAERGIQDYIRGIGSPRSVRGYMENHRIGKKIDAALSKIAGEEAN